MHDYVKGWTRHSQPVLDVECVNKMTVCGTDRESEVDSTIASPLHPLTTMVKWQTRKVDAMFPCPATERAEEY